MRFVHMADIHFDSPFTVLASKKELASIRRLEQREAFKKAIEYIKKERIPFLFISGDLYEQEYIRESTIEYINNLFKTIPETKIFISPGNHDPFLNNSFYNTYEWNENVTIFKGEIKRIELEDVDIYGYGFSDFYCIDSKIDEIEIKNKNKINILIIHGSLDASKTLDMQYNPINSVKLKKVGFDYVALGHIHKSNYNNNENNFIYPGSLISFGFDELGEHGFLDIEINKLKKESNSGKNKKIKLKIKNNSEKNKINKLKIKNNLEKNKINKLKIKNNSEKNKINKLKIKNNIEENKINKLKIENNLEKNKINNLIIRNNLIKKERNNLNKIAYQNDKINNSKGNDLKQKNIKFIKIDNRTFAEKSINISHINSEENLIEEINKVDVEEDKFYKIILEGTKKIEINKNKICKLIAKENILKVKDKTKIEYNFDILSKQKNLKGIFINKMLKRLKDKPEEEEYIKKAIEIGLKSFE